MHKRNFHSIGINHCSYTAVLREAWATLPESSSWPLPATLAQSPNLAHVSLETAVGREGVKNTKSLAESNLYIALSLMGETPAQGRQTLSHGDDQYHCLFTFTT